MDSMDTKTSEVQEDELSVSEIRGWAEFSAWSALVMTPIIWWLQGPSVSTDQFVVRTGLVVLSFVVATGLRIWAYVQPCSPNGNAQKTEAGGLQK